MQELCKKYPLIKQMADQKEVFWLNENLSGKTPNEITEKEIGDATERLIRFAPYIKKAFPETEVSGGIIESPLVPIPNMQDFLAAELKAEGRGRMLLKCDNLLPVSGSIKARGGIYEVLCLAEKIALESGLSLGDDYSALNDKKFRDLFSKYSIAVGSTGNLGLSIGIMGAKLGFNVTVHMSADARQWKKELLRQKGACVVEYEGDYGKAVEEGRRQAAQDKFCHFVDDENSKTLFLGYSTAASRLQRQMQERGLTVNKNHPLFVYLPCGVGGGPGGVAYGLKQIYGKNVHCFFAEPVNSPCMLLGVMTGLHDKICVQDIGLSGKTIADGLAVGRPSKFVGKAVGDMLDGIFTASDSRMESLVKELYGRENIFIEPSATAGFSGYNWVLKNESFAKENLENAIHIVWATGGGMVPDTERAKYIS